MLGTIFFAVILLFFRVPIVIVVPYVLELVFIFFSTFFPAIEWQQFFGS